MINALNAGISLNWLRFVPYVPLVATSSTRTHFINKNLVYQWDLHLAEFLLAFIKNSYNLAPLNILYPTLHITSDILTTYYLSIHKILIYIASLINWTMSLKFTYELEYNDTLPFLDILLIRNINKLEFKAYHKPTCTNDHIHFFSHHNNNTKRGIIIGLYLRALRICSSKFTHIENYFLNLQYPKSFIHFAKSKALKIHNKNQSQTNVYTISDKTSSPHRYITLPNNSSSHNITNNLNKLNIKTTSLPSKTIRELVHSSPQRNVFSDAGVYCIPCKDCKLKYIGEISRNLHVRLKEHKRDMWIGNSKNALFLHISQHNHNFDFNSAKMVTYIHNKNLRRIFEAAAISFLNSLNTRPGFYNISPYLSKHILNSYNIFHPQLIFSVYFIIFMLSIFLFVLSFFSSFWLEIFLVKQKYINSIQYS